MAIASNKMTPILGLAGLAIAGTILYMQFSGGATPKARPMQQVPSALPAVKGADQDTPTETMATLVAGNKKLQDDVQRVLRENKELQDENRRLNRNRPAGADPAPAPNPAAAASANAAGAADTPIDALSRAFGNASETVGRLSETMPDKSGSRARAGNASLQAGARGASESQHRGSISYKLMPPMGYAAQTAPGKGAGQGVAVTRFVRTTVPTGAGDEAGGTGPAARAAQAAAKKPEPTPYFTIPENATLAGVTAMTSLIGRVPIDGRVTDPMQFKAMVGRDNLAANGWELPDDLAGMIVTGVAIGDMALSCSEGKVRSITFVFNDGAIRTVSSRRGSASGMGTSGAYGTDIGFVSDEHGNPCIQGTFVTNAPAYLTDIVGVRSLGLASHALAEAQRTTITSALTGTTTSALTGSAGKYALGQAAAGATDELSAWLTQRLKNSFDAVVTPSGARLVVHLDREIALDKAPDPRKIVHRAQASANAQNGTRYGLE